MNSSTPGLPPEGEQYSFWRFLLLHPSWSQHTKPLFSFLFHTLLLLEFPSKIPSVLHMWPNQYFTQSLIENLCPITATHIDCRNCSDFLWGVLAGDHCFLLSSIWHHFCPIRIGTCILLPQDSISKSVCLPRCPKPIRINSIKIIFFHLSRFACPNTKSDQPFYCPEFSHPNLLNCLIVVDISGKGHYRDHSRGKVQWFLGW